MQYERGWCGVLSAGGTDGLRKEMSLQYRDHLLILPGIDASLSRHWAGCPPRAPVTLRLLRQREADAGG